MDFKKEIWNKEDLEEFNLYLKSIKNSSRILWTQKIVNTKMKVLAIKTKQLKSIANEISKGNYLSFLDRMDFYYYESTIIYAHLLTKIKDFKIIKKYLDIYSINIDNWSSVDTLKFSIINDIDEFKELVKEYINDKNEFRRRIAIIILFQFLKLGDINFIFEIIEKLYNEESYYVNMAISWILCECFIKRKEDTIDYLKQIKINSFVKKKMYQKCKDSFRVNNEDIEQLINQI